MSELPSTMTEQEVATLLRGLAPIDVPLAAQARMRARAHRALAGSRGLRREPRDAAGWWLTPVAYALGATTYLVWAVSAVQAILRP